MPLPSGMNKEVFDDIGYGSTLPRSQPVDLDDSAKPEPKKRTTRTPAAKPKKQAEGKVSCTFHLPQSLRDDLQALAFMSQQPQTQIVEDAIRSVIKRKSVDLPKRAA